jgi:DNA-binding MarR family transcriptional regulator
VPGDLGKPDPARGPRDESRAAGEDQRLRILRYSHIFASIVREVLEVKLLREVCHDPLTLSQLHLLKLISFNGQHQVGQMADFLGVSPPAATKNIDKLERLGFVVRTPSKGDRRATLISVSAKGRELVQKYEQCKAALLTPVLAHFRREEAEQFTKLLERFSVLLLGAASAEPGVCLRCAAYVEPDCPVGEVQGGCRYQRACEAVSGDPGCEDGSG